MILLVSKKMKVHLQIKSSAVSGGKKFSGQFHKTFFRHNLHSYLPIALSFYSGYTTRDIIYAKRSFFEMDTRCQFHKTFFRHNLHSYLQIALSFDSGYTTRDIIYAKRSFLKWTPDANFTELFSTQFLLLSAYCPKF
jgi:hypothetical protein